MEAVQFESMITPKGNVIGNYLFIKMLGSNDMGEIWKVIHIEKEKFYAIKKIDKFKIDSNIHLEKLLRSEVVIMHSIKHNNVMHLYDFFESKNNYYLVTDFCQYGNLQDILNKKKRFKESDAVNFLQQILSGFLQLRKSKILHRNISLDNIFYDKN